MKRRKNMFLNKFIPTGMFITAIFIFNLLGFVNFANAITIVKCENGLFGVTVTVNGKAVGAEEFKTPWVSKDDLQKKFDEYSSKVPKATFNEIQTWIDNGEYGTDTFSFKKFWYNIDPISEVWVFPDDKFNFVEIDTDSTPFWNVPPTTGTWDSEFISHSPYDEFYPQSGVKFHTADMGLTFGGLTISKVAEGFFEIFSELEDIGMFSLGTEISGKPDTASHWDVYTYDSSTKTYTFTNDSQCIPEPSTIILLGFGIIASLAWFRKEA
ncbi:MAG: PEP-CTERM sorting domain-containing protein [Bacteroidetes bacterium]|nr:PEP-CTERM sorting domain-containing protein [Bacteroidota bacterium]